MVDEKQICDLAKSLVEISLKDGDVCGKRVREVLKALAANQPRNCKSLLRMYKKYVDRKIASYTAYIEHAGPISNNITYSVKKFIEEEIDRSVDIDSKETPELIAGLRVTIGDNVYENSIDYRLSPLADTIL
jgi:F0F1-type ATP synthase delta subunit